VLGMAMTIGFYLFDNVQCWKCNTLLDTELTNLRESIASVGKGDVNSQKHYMVKMEELGNCAKAIYIRKISTDDGLSCRSICPNHPNNCWVMYSERLCGETVSPFVCIDISGDMNIVTDILPPVSDDTGMVLQDQWYIGSSTPLSIIKTGVDTIKLDRI
jgi:hypothetical protein